MRADVIDEANLGVGVAEGDEVFAEQPDAQRCAVGFGQVDGLERGNPVLAEKIAHRSARSDARQEFVF